MNLVKYILVFSLITLAGCTLTKKVKDGDTAFRLKQYAVAVDMLEQEFRAMNGVDDKYRKALYLAESYDILQEYDEAIKWYEKASDLKDSPELSTSLAYAYKKNEQYSDALSIFQKQYAETRQSEWRTEVALCQEALSQKGAKNYNVSTFSANTEYNEYSPIYLDEDHIVFTSDREESTGGNDYKWTGNAFSDLYVANIRGRKVNNFDGLLNTGSNEGTACFSMDRNEIFFTRCESIDLRDQYCRIYFSHRPNGFWMEAEPLMFFEEETNFAHPCLIEQDSVLIFAAAPKTSDGTYDLYYSERVDGGWTEPELMPSSLNSVGNEKFPTAYNDTLFFSSDKLPGYGGLDIFKTYLKADGSWALPENMGTPINSGGDDFGLAVDPRTPIDRGVELQGYLSSSRTVGMGDDIFFFTKYVTTEEEEDKPIVTEEKKKSRKIYLSVRVVEVEHLNDDPNEKIVGKSPLSKVPLAIMSVHGDKAVSTDNSGRYITEVLSFSDYNIKAAKEGFLAGVASVRTDVPPLMSRDTTINVEIALERIRYDSEIVLKSIYYDYERWEIRKDAKPSLDTLLNILQLNPELTIQLGSHTDCRERMITILIYLRKELSQQWII